MYVAQWSLDIGLSYSVTMFSFSMVPLAAPHSYPLKIINYIFYTILLSVLSEFFWKRSQGLESQGEAKEKLSYNRTFPEENTGKCFSNSIIHTNKEDIIH